MTESSPGPSPGHFPTTQWTQVIAVIQNGDEAAALRALAEFCERYRPAIYNFFRRRGCRHQQAEDYTQDFFLSRIHKRWDLRKGFLFSAQKRERSRFRVFLKSVLQAFLIDQWRAGARDAPGNPDAGGDFPAQSLADPAADGFEKEFDRAFAMETIHQAIAAAKPSAFDVAHMKGEITQSEAAAGLGISAEHFRVSYLRFRRRLRDALWELVSRQIEAGRDDTEIKSEIRYLMSLFASPAP